MEVAFIKPSTSGKVEVYCAKPGSKGVGGLAFTRVEKRAAMRWVVADYA
jgi:hypothetical protein